MHTPLTPLLFLPPTPQAGLCHGAIEGCYYMLNNDGAVSYYCTLVCTCNFQNSSYRLCPGTKHIIVEMMVMMHSEMHGCR